MAKNRRADRASLTFRERQSSKDVRGGVIASSVGLVRLGCHDINGKNVKTAREVGNIKLGVRTASRLDRSDLGLDSSHCARNQARSPPDLMFLFPSLK